MKAALFRCPAALSFRPFYFIFYKTGNKKKKKKISLVHTLLAVHFSVCLGLFLNLNL